jgi:hypothetical protein
MRDGGYDGGAGGGGAGGGERIARCGWVEVQDGRFALCAHVWWMMVINN